MSVAAPESIPAPVSGATSTPLTSPPTPPGSAVAVERAVIDEAARAPVLTFFTTGVGWLMISTLLGALLSIKLHSPNFLADLPWLTYGRILPAYNLTLTYGWASLSGMGVAIWLMSRLCRVPIRYPAFVLLGAAFWNLGLLMGVLSVLGGEIRPIEGLEMPRGAAAIMFIGYLLVGIWGAILYRFRRNAPVYISVWYLLGAFFWFPWLFATSHVLVSLPQVRGIMQSIVAAWYSQGFMLLWLTAIGLAAAYYLIPKVINRPIYSYNLAAIGFWTFAFFGGLTGMTRLNGGPVPAWLITMSIAASIMMLIPIATVATNFFFTMRGHTHMVYYSPTIRFTFFGVIAFTIASVINLIASLRSADRVLHFTQFQAAQQHLVIYAFFSMVMFASIYYITPRLVGCEWLSSTLIKMHFWGSAYGGGMAIAMLAFAGLASGLSLADPDATFAQIIQIGQVYLPGHTIAYALIALAHLIFGLHFLLMLLRIGQPGGEPTLFDVPGEAHH
jgi:cytochrome c oxidase cbb3-type subunit 1